MSIISSRHTVQPFVSGESKPLTGQRLAKIGYKNTDKTPAKFPSICVSVPHIETTQIVNNIEILAPVLKDYLSEVQDKIIRAIYESRAGQLDSVSDDEISIQSIVSYLESESTGSRLTKEYLETWFTQNIQDNLTVVIAEKLDENLETDESMARVSSYVDTYKNLISSLSSGRTSLNSEQINGVRRCIEISSVDDETAQKLINRVNKMEKDMKNTLINL